MSDLKIYGVPRSRGVCELRSAWIGQVSQDIDELLEKRLGRLHAMDDLVADARYPFVVGPAAGLVPVEN